MPGIVPYPNAIDFINSEKSILDTEQYVGNMTVLDQTRGGEERV
jgi:hypothetical protein